MMVVIYLTKIIKRIRQLAFEEISRKYNLNFQTTNNKNIFCIKLFS